MGSGCSRGSTSKSLHNSERELASASIEQLDVASHSLEHPESKYIASFPGENPAFEGGELKEDDVDSGVGATTHGIPSSPTGTALTASTTGNYSTQALLSTLEPSEPEVTMPVIPEIQKPAPQFRGIAVVDGQFKEISLADYAGKYVILFFYPLDFTFVCPTEIIAFSDRAEEFRQIGCEVIACSTDSHFSHLAWVNTPRKQGGLGSMNIPLLADKSTVVSKSYGVYKEDEGLTFRGLFIIDDKQRLRQITINDLPVGRSVDETLRLVQAFQFTDKHGEVCPAGWKPGSKTMKADPSGSKEYFEGQH